MDHQLFASERLLAFTSKVLATAGVDAGESRVIADNLVTANLRGIDSHGIVRLPQYVGRLKAGLIAPETRVEVVREAPATCVLDAHNGWGAVAGMAGMQQAIRRARQCGTGVATVRHSNHFGIAAYYAQAAVSEQMIGVAMTNASANMAPWGGRRSYFGTNPICVAVPAGREKPVIYDGATSVVAIGKIVLAAKQGEAIPPEWAVDREGLPTTDPGAATSGGSLLPMGGYKGYGLAMIVDVLTGMLSGAAFGHYVSNLRSLDGPQNVGHFFAALNISSFLDPKQFADQMETMVRDVKQTELASGSERIYLPGEKEWLMEEQRRREGIPVPESVVSELRVLEQQYGIPL